MIRRLSQADRNLAVDLLNHDPIHNLYLIGNITQLGFETEYCEFWGDFARGDDSNIRGLINRYMNGWSIYGAPDADWGGLAEVMDSHPVAARRLQDNPGGVDSFTPYLGRYSAAKSDEEELMMLAENAFRPIIPPADASLRRAALADLDELADFYSDAGSMSRTRAGVQRPLRDLRVWVASSGGRIRAAALTNAEVPKYAMIGGVYTEPASRNLGLARAVCSALCAELLAEGKQPALYWQDPAAGTVYRKLGFRAIGTWRSVWLRQVVD